MDSIETVFYVYLLSIYLGDPEYGVKKTDLEVEFIVTDFNEEILISYQGILPNLFKENSGVVASGSLDGNIFKAKEILAKHDENYMPVKLEEK